MGGGCEGAGAVLTPVGATPSGIWVVGRGCEGAGAVLPQVGATPSGIWVVGRGCEGVGAVLPPVGAAPSGLLQATLATNSPAIARITASPFAHMVSLLNRYFPDGIQCFHKRTMLG